MIKGIVFDKDGTLLDYESFWIPVAEGAIGLLTEGSELSDRAGELLAAIGAYDGIKGVLCHGTYGNITDALNEYLGEEVFTVGQVSKAFADSVHLADVLPTCGDIRGLFEKLLSRGIILAVVTSDNASLTEYCLSKLGIADMLHAVYTDDRVHPSKPDPYYMNKFCSEYGFKPCEVMMVGDTMTDMRFAENAGCVAVGVGKYAPELLSRAADFIISDISQIPLITEVS